MGTYKTLIIRDMELHRALKQRAATNGVSVVSLVERFVREGLGILPSSLEEHNPRGKSTIRSVDG